MRLQRDLVIKREDFLLNVFLAEPKLSIAKGNEKLKGAFDGQMMRPERAYAIRAKAREKLAQTGKVLGRRGGHVPVRPARYVIRAKR